jgi:hypothetical protein
MAESPAEGRVCHPRPAPAQNVPSGAVYVIKVGDRTAARNGGSARNYPADFASRAPVMVPARKRPNLYFYAASRLWLTSAIAAPSVPDVRRSCRVVRIAQPMMMRVNALARVLGDRPAKTTDSYGAPGRRVGADHVAGHERRGSKARFDALFRLSGVGRIHRLDAARGGQTYRWPCRLPGWWCHKCR